MQKINNKICGSGDAIVGYIYNELSSAERLAFEDHLLDCTACTDEFAAIADSRYAVYEWQKLEFEPMATPHFAIPYAETKVSWFDAIKGVFATRPRLAAAGAFGLLIAVFISAAVLMLPSSGTIAFVEPVIDTFPASSVEKANPAAVIETVAPVNEQKAKAELAVAKPQPKSERKQSSNRRNNVRTKNINNETQAKAPRLNDFEDLSDDSLRLSDLVADVDSRD